MDRPRTQGFSVPHRPCQPPTPKSACSCQIHQKHRKESEWMSSGGQNPSLSSFPTPAVSPAQVHPSAKVATGPQSPQTPKPHSHLSHHLPVHCSPSVCPLHRPDISRCCVAQFPDQYLSIHPLNIRLCFCFLV